ncbi:hypothetical protein [Microtetraspora glauca]|uniref:Secreted protein n=1 Tax=Microtetraspora glauca TaxID=1996 RepID=A0ABV3GBW4_MICGL
MSMLKSAIAGLVISTAMTGGAVALGATTTATTASAAVVQTGGCGCGNWGGAGRNHNRNWNRNHNRNRQHQRGHQRQHQRQRQHVINNITIRLPRDVREERAEPTDATTAAPLTPVAAG